MSGGLSAHEYHQLQFWLANPERPAVTTFPAGHLRDLALAFDEVITKGPRKVVEVPVGNETLLKKIKLLSGNYKFLQERMDELHTLLCRGKQGNWQERAQQVVDAAIELSAIRYALSPEHILLDFSAEQELLAMLKEQTAESDLDLEDEIFATLEAFMKHQKKR